MISSQFYILPKINFLISCVQRKQTQTLKTKIWVKLTARERSLKFYPFWMLPHSFECYRLLTLSSPDTLCPDSRSTVYLSNFVSKKSIVKMILWFKVDSPSGSHGTIHWINCIKDRFSSCQTGDNFFYLFQINSSFKKHRILIQLAFFIKPHL